MTLLALRRCDAGSTRERRCDAVGAATLRRRIDAATLLALRRCDAGATLRCCWRCDAATLRRGIHTATATLLALRRCDTGGGGVDRLVMLKMQHNVEKGWRG